MSTRKHGQSLILVTAVVCAIMLGTVSPSAATTPVWGYSYEQLSAEWWKWTLSIPGSVNPVSDETGDYCAVGQYGDVWFLAGTYEGTVQRDCPVPEGTPLFFPVANAAFFDSPGVCGQDSHSYSVKEMRDYCAWVIDNTTNLSATLDGKPVRMQRVRSIVYYVAIPGGDPTCPAGIYSPAVDDGYYVLLSPLKKGPHKLHIHAERPDADWPLDVTYDLTVVPLKLK